MSLILHSTQQWFGKMAGSQLDSTFDCKFRKMPILLTFFSIFKAINWLLLRDLQIETSRFNCRHFSQATKR